MSISLSSSLSPPLGGGVACLKSVKALQICVQWRQTFFDEFTEPRGPFKIIGSVFRGYSSLLLKFGAQEMF